jgi:hypothetical protein
VKILHSFSYELCFTRKYHKGKEVRICITLLQPPLAEHYSRRLIFSRQGLYRLQTARIQLLFSQHSPHNWVSDTHWHCYSSRYIHGDSSKITALGDIPWWILAGVCWNVWLEALVK